MWTKATEAFDFNQPFNGLVLAGEVLSSSSSLFLCLFDDDEDSYLLLSFVAVKVVENKDGWRCL